MKILIAYDGSSCSEVALDDLMRSGLPASCEALVISVAEVWLPPPGGDFEVSGIKLDQRLERILQNRLEKDQTVVAEASTLSNHAKQRLQRLFPEWRVKAEASYGSPAWEILTRADELRPDLVVVGSHGRSGIRRFFLGSISQKVLTEAHCPVRVARGRDSADGAGMRLIIGFDGSRGAEEAVEEVSDRSWPQDTEVHLLAATAQLTPSAIERFVPPVAHLGEEVSGSEREWVERRAEDALTILRSKGLSATLQLRSGNPKDVLVEEAERWNADCIFVGANACGSRLERFLLGSTAAAVAARAHCSVEVVRKTT